MLLLLINLLLCFLFFCFVPCLLCVSFGHFFFLVSYHLSTFHLWPLRWMMTVTGVHEVNSLWNTGQLLGIWAFSFFSSLPHLLQRIFCVRVCSVMSDSLKPHGRQPTRLLCPWKFPGKSTGVGCYSYSRGYSQPRHRTTSPALAGRFFATVPPGKTSYFSQWLHGFCLGLFCFHLTVS